MKNRELVNQATERFRKEGISSPENDALLLFYFVSGWDRIKYMMKENETADERIEKEYEKCVCRREKREPLQYITNVQNFYGADFYVDERVLIPRYDTEILVETILDVYAKGVSWKKGIDLCTGSGCIAITLDRKIKEIKMEGIDISEEALCVAGKNNQQLNAKVDFYQSDLYCKVKGKYDMIVSNPPYISRRVLQNEVEPEVSLYEPRVALDGEADGLSFYRRLIARADEYIVDGGYIFFEIGYDQAAEVKSMLEAKGWKDIQVVKDYAGLDRVVYAIY